MNRKLTSVFVVLTLLTAGVAPVAAGSGTDAVQTSCSFPVTETDATGTDVTVEENPERVVTLSPSAAQTMWEIGGESQVVGLSQHALYLEGADSRTNVSGEGQSLINVEKVVSTEPDLVLAPNVIQNDTVQKLRDAGLTVYRFEAAENIEDIYAKTELIGRLTDNCEGADETVSWMKDRIGTVREAVADSDSPRVLYTFFGYTAGEGTFINEMIETAGGEHVAATANISGYQQINEEIVVEHDPEWILLNSDAPMVPKSDAYNGTYAVQNDQTLVVNADYISQPAPRVVYSVQKMAEAFHPDAYAEANASAGSTSEGALAEETTTDDSSSSVPGFGVPATLAALVGVVLLARRP